MANCIECSGYVGCSCNLHNGLCITCFSKSFEKSSIEDKSKLSIKLNLKMSKQEKIDRLNKILEEKRAKK